jgi:Arc/MetJ-type ribon-helix-helix transcriptional regulator
MWMADDGANDGKNRGISA